jgi:hypothetical protein
MLSLKIHAALWPTISPTNASWLPAAQSTKINSSDPPLTAVRTASASEPLLPFFHPPVKLASFQPCGRLYVDGRVDLSAICCGMLLHLSVAEIHI